MDSSLLCTIPFLVADGVLALLVLRQRRQRQRLPARPAVAKPKETEAEPVLIIGGRAAKREAPPAGYRANELNAGQAPMLSAPVAHKPHPRSFTDRCSQAVTDVMLDSNIGFQAVVPAGERQAAPVVGPRTLTFLLTLNRPQDLEKVLGLDERLALLAAVEAARVARYRGVIGIEFQLPPGRWTTLALDRPGAGQHMRLGLNTMNKAARLDLSDASTAHVLVAGTNGSGKTVLMTSMLYQAALADPGRQRLLLIDGKQELEGFENLAHLVAPRVVSPEDALKALAWTAAEIMRRSEPGADRTPLTVAIDELALLVAQDRGAVKPLAQILSLGRSRNVHVIAGTQRVTSDVLGNRMIADNFTARLAGYVPDASASALATGQPGLGANRLSSKGDFLLVTGGRAARFVAAVTSAAQLAALPRVDHVENVLDDTTVEPLAMIETVAPGQTPLPTTPAQYASVVSAYVHAGEVWPGIGKVASSLGVGKTRAERIIMQAGELIEEFDRAGVGLVAKD